MLNDVLLIAEKHEIVAKDILTHILNPKSEIRNPKFIVAISGESGSGKSEVSHVLAKLLKNKSICAKIIHIDNYYKIPPLKRTEWRLKNGMENVGFNEYDWDTIYQNLKDFKENKTSTLPCIDIITDQVDSMTTDFKGVDMLIIDGLYAIKTDGIDLRIMIELTYHETKKAQLLRGKEPQNEYRMQVLEREHQVVQSLRPLADLFINMDYKLVVR
jgi:uridine kinase